MAMSFFFFTLKIGISSRNNLFFRFGEHLRLVSLALSIPVLGLEKSVLGLGLGFFCIIGLGFERCVLDSTSVLDKY